MQSNSNERRILNWQERWQGLADALERAMENTTYRMVMCLATVVLILAYVVVATRSVEPTHWPQNALVHFRETDVREYDFKKWERAERAVRNVSKMHRALSVGLAWQPTPISLDLSFFEESEAFLKSLRWNSASFAIEAHVLRLWMDELRGQPALGVFDLAAESVVRVIIWELFPAARPASLEQVSLSTWFDEVQTMAVSCRSLEEEVFGKLGWSELCRSKSISELGRSNPMSLVNWMATGIHRRIQSLSPIERFTILRSLMNRATSVESMRFDRAQSWSDSATDFGQNLMLISDMLEIRDLVSSPEPVRTYHVTALNEELDSRVRFGLLVVKSCVFPEMKQFSRFQARELVWVQTCDQEERLVAAQSADEFAARNPHLLMAKIGLDETRLAIDRGWLNGSTRITELSGQQGVGQLHRNLQAQREEWRSDLKVLKLSAPVDVLQFVRPVKN